jgi:hypothetical protein
VSLLSVNAGLRAKHLAASFAGCWLLAATGALQAAAPATMGLRFDPPRIVVSNQPRRLLLVDGPPALVPIPGTRLEFVVNTDWTVFRDSAGDAWFLLDDGRWLRNTLLASGRWLNTTTLPRDFLTLQVSSDWPEVAAAMPPRPATSEPVPFTISYEPTVLVLIDGDTRLEGLGAGTLKYVPNTDSDLFFLDDRYYLLLAGRWFTTRDFRRAWSAVRELPAVFATIPEDHPKARVLASVPGTGAARKAMQEALEPHTAVLDAAAGAELAIPWFGEPRFVEIEGTGLHRGENTPWQVIAHNNAYYLCHEGAWYRSSSPMGPWRAAREIPEAIFGIPPADPAYNVSFVRVQSFDDTSGRVAYESSGGYYNRYWTGSAVVYGTGWYHAGYYDRSVYWRYPWAYGYWGPHWSAPYPYRQTRTLELSTEDYDWEWRLDGSKRRVYRYGPRNRIGEPYVMPESDILSGGGRQRP